MRYALLVLACVCTAAAFAQTTKPDPKRVNAIWDAVTARTSQQQDIWFDAGDYPRATQILRFDAATDPSDYFASFNLGWMLENMERWDEALATYIRYRKNNPDDKNAPYPEANFYFLQRAYSKVPPLMEPTLSKKPDVNSYRILGHAYERLGLYPDAERVWKKMVEDHPEDSVGKANLLKVQRRLAQQRGAASGKA